MSNTLQEFLSKSRVLDGYADNLPAVETRIEDARKLSQEGLGIVFGFVGREEDVWSGFMAELKFAHSRLDGNQFIGPYVTFNDDAKPFAPAGLAVWQRNDTA